MERTQLLCDAAVSFLLLTLEILCEEGLCIIGLLGQVRLILLGGGVYFEGEGELVGEKLGALLTGNHSQVTLAGHYSAAGLAALAERAGHFEFCIGSVCVRKEQLCKLGMVPYQDFINLLLGLLCPPAKIRLHSLRLICLSLCLRCLSYSQKWLFGRNLMRLLMFLRLFFKDDRVACIVLKIYLDLPCLLGGKPLKGFSIEVLHFIQADSMLHFVEYLRLVRQV